MTASLRVVRIRFDFPFFAFNAVAFTLTCSTGVLASVMHMSESEGSDLDASATSQRY